MTALWTLAYDARAEGMPPLFGIAADDTQVGYVTLNESLQRDLDARVELMKEAAVEDGITEAHDWIGIAQSNFSYMRFTEPVSEETYEDALAEVQSTMTFDEVQGE
jgi:hypothetical protein